MHQLCRNILEYVRKRDLLRAGHRVGVAVSGGADSVGLLRVLLELAPELGIVLEVAHLNHQLRGIASDKDEQFVRELAAKYDLPAHCESRQVAEFSRQNKLGLEAAGRHLRYEFFSRLMRQSKLDRIATAHTLNDQAETVLLKLSRGAGTRGLAGIFPEVTVQAGSITADLAPTKDTGAHAIIRPLLGTPRAKIEAFLNDLGQSWREDATNQELHHTRNRIRHKVLPLLESEANPNILGTLAETAEIAHAEETYWDQLTREHLQSCFEIGFAGGKLDCEKVRKLPLALQRRLVRAGGEAVGLHLEFHHVEQVLDLLGSGPPATLPDGWNAHRRNQAICFERESDGNPCSFPLQVPGEVRIGTLRIVASKVSSSQGLNASEPLLDCSFAASGLVVRNWHEGERFWPAHRKQARKIKELLQDRHVTGPAKKKWPVIAAGEHIVWVRGFGVGQQFISKEDAGVLIREISTEQESTSTSGSPNRPCGP